MSLRKAINAHCKSCIYDDAEKGTWVKQVENCTVYKCDLYKVRPLTKASKQLIKTTSI